MCTILKRAIIPWHRAYILSSADTLLPPILLPEKQSKIQLLIFTLVRKKKKLKQLGLNLCSLELQTRKFNIN